MMMCGWLCNAVCTYFLIDTADHALKSLTWTTFCEIICTICNHVLNTLCPANTACELCYQVVLDFCSISVWLTVHILIDWALRCAEVGLLNSSLEFILCRLHQW